MTMAISNWFIDNTQQKHRMAIENLIFDRPVQALFSEKKKITKPCFRGKMFAFQKKETEEIFRRM